MAADRQQIVVDLQAQVDSYVQGMAQANQSNKLVAESLDKAVDGIDKLKSAGDKALGALEAFGPLAKANAEQIRKITDPAQRAAAALEALEKQQRKLSSPTGLDRLNGHLGKAAGQLEALKIQAGPAGLAIGALTASVGALGAATLKYLHGAAREYLSTTEEGRKQTEFLDDAMTRLTRTIGKQVAQTYELGDVYEGLGFKINELSSYIRTMDKDLGAFAKGSLLTAVHLLTGGLSTSVGGVAETLAEEGKRVKAVRKEHEALQRYLAGARKRSQERNKPRKKSSASAPARGDGGFGGEFGDLYRAEQQRQQDLFEAEQLRAPEREVARGLEPLTEQMRALEQRAKASIKTGNELAEAFARGADQGLAAQNEQLQRYNENLQLAGQATAGLTGFLGDQLQVLASGKGGFDEFGNAAKAALASVLSSEGDAAIAKGAIAIWTNPAVGAGLLAAGLAAKATAGAISPGAGGGGRSAAGAARAYAPPPDLQGRLAGTPGTGPQESINNFYFDGRKIAQTQEPHLRERGRLGHYTTPTTRRGGASRR